MDPFNRVERGHLFEAIKYHRLELEPFRKTRVELVRDLSGAFFGEPKDGVGRARQGTVINLILQMTETIMLALAANRPRFLCTARVKGRGAFAKHQQVAINNLTLEIHLDKTLQACALDGIFGLAVAKVFLADAPVVEIENDVWMDPGSPFAARISPDDFVYDTSAEDFRKARFAADRYRIPFDDIRDVNGRFLWTPEHEEVIRPTSRRNLSNTEELARDIGKGTKVDPGEFEPMIDVVDVFLPRDNLVCTWACEGDMRLIDTDPLAFYEWDGVEDGPYHVLNLGPVPDQVQPSPPAQNLKFLNDLANSMYRHLNRQAKSQKTINIVEDGSGEDAIKLQKASDQDYVGIHNKDGIGLYRTGGVDQQTWQFANGVIDLADRMGGNISAKMGLGPQSETASQDRMIMGQVSRHEAFLQERMVDFTAGIGRHLSYLLFTDPVKEMPGKLRVEGTNYEYTSNWTPDYREGDWNDYDIALEPFSMAYKSPTDRANMLTEFVAGIMPLMPALEQQGWQFDVTKYLEQQAELRDMPRLLEIFKPGVPSGELAGSSHQATQSPVTRRETVRTGAGGTGGVVKERMQPQQQANSMVGVQ